MRDIMQKYIADGTRVLDRLEQDSLHANAVSHELLMDLVRKNQDTEYGRKYGFKDIYSYADYAAKVPLSDYEDYEPFIERMLSFGQKNLLSADDVVYYAHTSGTTGTSKMIPCTQKALDVLFTAGHERVFGLHDKTLRDQTGEGMPSCRGLNIMEAKTGYTAYGTAHGAISETLLIPEDTAQYNILPKELIYPTADFDRRHLKMLFALRERHLGFMHCTFAPFLYDMISYLRRHWDLLCEDLESGRISPQIMVDPALRKKLEARMTPDPDRAAQVRSIMAAHENDAFIPLLWPDMKLVAAIGAATFAPYIEKLRQFLGNDIAMDHLGYISSEATIGTVLREDQPEYILIPWGGFYEFIPVEEEGSERSQLKNKESEPERSLLKNEESEPERPLLMNELEVGKEYELIVTNLSGFYRYRQGDVVRVTGYHNECPILVFSYRKSQLISMYGEKVTETVLYNAVEAMGKESRTAILEYSVYADMETDPGHYTVLLESDREISPDLWPYYSEILNRKLCEAHDSYRKKIEQKTMLPLQAKFVQPQTYALYRDLKVLGGASPNQIKPLHVIPEGRWKRFFFGLLQISQ